VAVLDVQGFSEFGLSSDPAPLQITDTSAAPMVMRQFPWGAYFDRSAGWLPATARGIARFLSRLKGRQRAFVRQMDPRTADELLDEWESSYAIEPDAMATLEDRRDAVLAKVRSLGGNTIAYYEAVATDFGYADAVVTDAADPFTTLSTADDVLAGGPWKVTFLVTAASQGAVRDDQLQDLINGQLLAGWFAIYDLS
jgi:uncharacterized protein YmfQ (DUF2313 family)